MAVLKKTAIAGRIACLGVVRDRAMTLRSEPRETVEAGFDGACHSGLTPATCGRVRARYPVGAENREVRQIAIFSVEELAATAEAMAIARIAPEWVGVNVVFEGLPDVTPPPPRRACPPLGAPPRGARAFMSAPRTGTRAQ